MPVSVLVSVSILAGLGLEPLVSKNTRSWSRSWSRKNYPVSVLVSKKLSGLGLGLGLEACGLDYNTGGHTPGYGLINASGETKAGYTIDGLATSARR